MFACVCWLGIGLIPICMYGKYGMVSKYGKDPTGVLVSIVSIVSKYSIVSRGGFKV